MSARVGHSNLGGFLLAVGRLQPDAGTARAIAQLVHLVAEAAEELAPPLLRDVQKLPPELPGSSAQVTGPPTTNPPSERLQSQPVPTGAERELRVVLRRGPEPIQSTLLPPSPSASSATHVVRVPVLEPLLRPVATRAIVATSLAQRNTAGGSVDIDRLVALCAEKHSIEKIPLRRRWSIANRTLVLVDRGAGMTPFARDANELLERIRSVASRDRTEVSSYWGTPRRRHPLLPGSDAPVPPSGTAVLALTDLGIAPGAPSGVVADWLEYAQRLRVNGASLVIFIPYPAERWPAAAADLPLVTWDRPTTLAAVLATTRARKSR